MFRKVHCIDLCWNWAKVQTKELLTKVLDSAVLVSFEHSLICIWTSLLLDSAESKCNNFKWALCRYWFNNSGYANQGSTNCEILPPQMGESCRTLERCKTSNRWLKALKTICMIPFVNQMTWNTLFYGIYGDDEQIITYALEEHDPGSAQNWRASSGLW